MGIIASTFSSRDHIIEEIKIKRSQKLLKTDEITSKASSVPITEYNFSGQQNFESIHFNTSNELFQRYVLPKALNTGCYQKPYLACSISFFQIRKSRT